MSGILNTGDSELHNQSKPKDNIKKKHQPKNLPLRVPLLFSC